MKELKKGFLFAIGWHLGSALLITASKCLLKKIKETEEKNPED